MTRDWENAVRRESIDELVRLENLGADINAVDRHGQTALMLAAAQGSDAVVGWLIERGAALNHTAKYGLTALMLAVIRGHVEVVRRLAAAGANLNIRGTGAPGFAGKTALDLALDKKARYMVEILRSAVIKAKAPNPHFATARNWNAARALVAFCPLEPRHNTGFRLQAIRVYVRDHKLREVPFADRTLEAHYGAFSISEALKGVAEARRVALEVRYGRDSREAKIGGCEARVYELGPEGEPDDIDGRSPAIVVWPDGEMFYLVSSYEMNSDTLVKIANSLYPRAGRGWLRYRR